MEKKKRWQLFLIMAVILLTIYNVLPTIFYYSQPLNKEIDVPRAEKIAVSIAKRVNSLEEDSIKWLHSFCKLIGVKPLSISIPRDNPQEINLQLAKQSDGQKIVHYLPRAGALIPFVPSQLTLSMQEKDVPSKELVIKRQIPVRFDLGKVNDLFTFAPKKEKDKISDLYQKVTFDRAAAIISTLGGQNEGSLMLETIYNSPDSYPARQFTLQIAENIKSFSDLFGASSAPAKRYYSSLTLSQKEKGALVDHLLSSMDRLRDQIKMEIVKLKDLEKPQASDSLITKEEIDQQKRHLSNQEKLLLEAVNIVKKERSSFLASKSPYTIASSTTELASKNAGVAPITIDLLDRNPFIQSVTIDWEDDEILLTLHSDLANAKNKERYEQFLIDQIADISRLFGEKINTQGSVFKIKLDELNGSKSILVLKLEDIAAIQKKQLLLSLKNEWQPKHSELKESNFPIIDYKDLQSLPIFQKNLCLILFSPILDKETVSGMHSNSIYIIAKGLNRILQKYEAHADTAEAKQFFQDFAKLEQILKQNGFIGYPGKSIPFHFEFSDDFIFEKPSYFQNILAATREKFTVHGSQRYAVLELSNVEQRILTLNDIETKIHEDLLKWRDDYNAAQVNIRDPKIKYEIPKPTTNILWNNFILSFKKYFRGDDRKIIHWGLDLSGGKTVQIELRDQNNKIVTNEADLKQGVNELYNRVNKMGVSEVGIRIVGNSIVLDFPGSQGLSAADLVKASSMSFHIVNEKFTINNPALADAVNKFLKEVWNEAVVTNKKDIESINLLAYKHLYGNSLDSENVSPRSESAKLLYENGLRLSNPLETGVSNIFDDTLSKIAIFKGDDFTKWYNQTSPLLIVFNNYALEGSDLVNVRAAYDPSHGNYLTFGVKGSYTSKSGEKMNPRDVLHLWTSQFCKDKISGTALESYSRGGGWRMAVILNDYVISSPSLQSALKDSNMITGSFSQREVNQLVADLKAGSLSFTPKILSEKNVSPELGMKERVEGVVATFLALLFVAIAMISYYRFAGVIACIAVLFNLFIMWATLQNLQATLTLAGLAGVILTVAMAVDANVLVFERTKEEFAISGKISSAIQNGYRKAFSAIFDSNITTIIAALVLLHFDAGPIKGFAITLIIGIVSSMFTALFSTRHFFQRWVQNPHHTKLTMASFIKNPNFDFLKRVKYFIYAAAILIIIGFAALFSQRQTVFGIDFSGGFSLNIELEETTAKDFRQAAEKALVKYGATPQEIQVRELSPANNLRIILAKSFEKEGRPFFNMPLQVVKNDATYSYESNPRISWIVDAFNAAGLKIKPMSLSQLDSNWTLISGQMSDSMRNNAVIGIAIALLCILIYITFRFEFKYAFSAIICLVHDVAVALAMIGILHTLKVPIQIDLNTIAALLTITGYSLNDTIIIFDRIREDLKIYRKLPFEEIVNKSLNLTLSRTLTTSLITLIALLPLVLLGQSTIFGFALVMMIGVIFGTLSSFFIASPMLIFLNRREQKQKNAEVLPLK